MNTDNPLFEEVVALLLALNAAVLAETLLYGIHLILFCVCMYILLLRHKQRTQWFILVGAVLMFLLSTADIAITIRLMTHEVSEIFDVTKLPALGKLFDLKVPIYVSNNFIADLILLYRCYMVWGRSKYVLIGASFLVFGDTLWGYLGIGSPGLSFSQTKVFSLYVWSVFTINIIITTVTVARIFWVSRIAQRIIGTRDVMSYHTAMAVLAESSLVYTTCILVYILFPKPSAYRMVTVTVCMRIVTIMPTLLIVQVGLGRAINDGIITSTNVAAEVEGRTSVALDTMLTSMYGGDRRSISIPVRPGRLTTEDGHWQDFAQIQLEVPKSTIDV